MTTVSQHEPSGGGTGSASSQGTTDRSAEFRALSKSAILWSLLWVCGVGSGIALARGLKALRVHRELGSGGPGRGGALFAVTLSGLQLAAMAVLIGYFAYSVANPEFTSEVRNSSGPGTGVLFQQDTLNTVNIDKIKVFGTVKEGGAIALNGKNIPLQGRSYSTELDLKPGWNKVQVVFTAANKQKTTRDYPVFRSLKLKAGDPPQQPLVAVRQKCSQIHSSFQLMEAGDRRFYICMPSVQYSKKPAGAERKKDLHEYVAQTRTTLFQVSTSDIPEIQIFGASRESVYDAMQRDLSARFKDLKIQKGANLRVQGEPARDLEFSGTLEKDRIRGRMQLAYVDYRMYLLMFASTEAEYEGTKARADAFFSSFVVPEWGRLSP